LKNFSTQASTSSEIDKSRLKKILVNDMDSIINFINSILEQDPNFVSVWVE